MSITADDSAAGARPRHGASKLMRVGRTSRSAQARARLVREAQAMAALVLARGDAHR
jgi:hypothetical protein